VSILIFALVIPVEFFIVTSPCFYEPLTSTTE
jgi:hypothetical protein